MGLIVRVETSASFPEQDSQWSHNRTHPCGVNQQSTDDFPWRIRRTASTHVNTDARSVNCLKLVTELFSHSIKMGRRPKYNPVSLRRNLYHYMQRLGIVITHTRLRIPHPRNRHWLYIIESFNCRLRLFCATEPFWTDSWYSDI